VFNVAGAGDTLVLLITSESFWEILRQLFVVRYKTATSTPFKIKAALQALLAT
jgi:hypothetical protein